MDATDEAYLLMPSSFVVQPKSRESDYLWAPVVVIALVFVFVFFSLVFEVRRIAHLEQKEELQRLWRHQVARADVARKVAGLKKQKFQRIDEF